MLKVFFIRESTRLEAMREGLELLEDLSLTRVLSGGGAQVLCAVDAPSANVSCALAARPGGRRTRGLLVSVASSSSRSSHGHRTDAGSPCR